MLRQTKAFCDKLLEELTADVLDRNYMSQLRFSCFNQPSEYFYNKILKIVDQLEFIAEFGDIDLVARELHVDVYVLNQNPGFLYDKFESDDIKNKVAYELRHLSGIKYLWSNISNYYNTVFTGNKELVVFAIESNDYVNLNNLLIKNITERELQNFLKIAYNSNSLDCAHTLIHHGARFDLLYLTKVFFKDIRDAYLEHIDKLFDGGLIDNITFQSAKYLIRDIYSDAPFIIDSCCNYTVQIHSSILPHSKFLYVKINNITKSILSFIFAVGSPHIIVSQVFDINSFYSPDSQFFKIFISAINDSSFLQKFYHELTHFVLDNLFHNRGAPYPPTTLAKKNQVHEAYAHARHDFIQNIFEKLQISDVDFVNDTARENFLAEHFIFYANEYCYNKANLKIISLVLLKFKSNQQYFQKKDDINLLISQFPKQEDTLLDMIILDNSLSKDHDKNTELFKVISTKYGYNESKNLDILKKYLQIKKFVLTELNVHCKQDQYGNKEFVAFLHRVFDYFKRDESERDAELIPRFVEFYISNNLLTEVKKILEPIYNFFENYIQPQLLEVAQDDYANKVDDLYLNCNTYD